VYSWTLRPPLLTVCKLTVLHLRSTVGTVVMRKTSNREWNPWPTSAPLIDTGESIPTPARNKHTMVYLRVSGLAAWSENCKCHSSLPLGQLYRYFVSQSSEFCRHNPFRGQQRIKTKVSVYFVIDWVRKLLDTPSFLQIVSSTIHTFSKL